MLQRSVLALLAGVALAMAYEPFAVPVLVPVLVPLAVAAHTLLTRGLGLRRAFVVGLAFGVGFYYVHIYWMTTVALAAWLGLSAAQALFYGLLGSAVALVSRLPLWPLWVATAWVTVEVWRSGWPFSGMPWGRLGFAVVDTPVAATLPYVGMAGVTFLLALAGARSSPAWARRWRCPGPARAPAPRPWPSCRATCRARATTSSTTSAR